MHVKKYENHLKRTHKANEQYSTQKTNYLYRKGHSIKQIAKERDLKESTIYEHLAKLIEHSQTSIYAVLEKDKIHFIKNNIRSDTDTLKEIKQRISSDDTTYEEINLVLANIKAKNKKKNIAFHIKQHQKTKCKTKCRNQPEQRKACKEKLDELIKNNPLLELKRKQFTKILQTTKTCITYQKMPSSLARPAKRF